MIKNILPLVERPSRYLGTEINAVKKDLNRVKLRFALAFPDLYEIGTSHFGMQILYHLLNVDPDIAAERVFAPGLDLEALLRKTGKPLFSLESHAPLNRFHIIGFSLLYELNYTNVLTMLDLAGIPFLAADRDNHHPLIIAGGPCTCNPEPMADFFDAMIVGDGEAVIMQLTAEWLRWNRSSSGDRRLLLQNWSRIDGVYIPSFFEANYDEHSFQTLRPLFPDYAEVKRAIVDDLERTPFPDNPVVPFGRPVHDRLRLEVSRGCTRGCRFCQAGMIYRPVRERSPDNLMSLVSDSIANTGYEDISMLSLSTGDYGCLAPLIERLMARFGPEHVAVSLPSLRAGTLTPELMKLIKQVRKTGFTIAPEAGSQRLRDVINKNISEKEIFDTVQDAFQLGWQVIKLYFMIGLPTETDDDLKELVSLVQRLRKIKGTNRRPGKINVSVATFIPKSHTPFQWASQIALAESRNKIQWIHHQLKIAGVQFKWQDPEVSHLEGLWARGDRRLSRLLVAAYARGCKLDGWSDHFDYRSWQEAWAEVGIDPNFFTTRARDLNEPLPWDLIDNRVSRSYLQREWANACEHKVIEDCRQGFCNQCGACDFETTELKLYEAFGEDSNPACEPLNPAGVVYQHLCVSYSKTEQARYFGHLEMINIFLRALRRAGIPLKYSQGFHPKPKISFDDPLPVGIESQHEQFFLSVSDTIDPATITGLLSSHLPEGLKIHSCTLATRTSRPKPSETTYLVRLHDGRFNQDRLSFFRNSSEFTISLSNRKGKLKKIDLKDMVKRLELLDSKQLQVSLSAGNGGTLRPAQILGPIFKLSELQIKQSRVIKLKSAYR
ncbi:MAG: TIGR03960 family B12-binding radical SAM protein [Desulfobacterales bacterium]|nr:TIGR03960 family B12-binding radical SAM protein [Desulfobacterales bacterium]